MFPVEVLQQTLEKFTSILQQRNIRFHLTGGVTSATFGEPRMTQDIDIVVDPVQLRGQIEGVLSELELRGLLFDRSTVHNAIDTGGMFQLLDSAEALKLDVYPREMIAGELSRSITVEVFTGVQLPVVARGDAALSKLVWISKGIHKSRRDLRQIYRTSDAATQQSILRGAAELQLSDLLTQVIQEADEIR
jgi:hypothetical protein